ncbi:MAG: glycosyltransferase family 4 protein [Gemmatimonadetes bacterium]|nr:glycosyltransferase family 4 protein [Gemmatimonadota bacterium]MYA10483.1 glycosyltransferase family 4 protein [Gemmatimonadota bacterium]MYE68433.1 glycosyltransferase family 4 protein [Gemmatimonadota bacterium]MYJ69941.1 glycosyltransferase family 4 protein [Gemmatimonadota bacterium]
MAPLRILVVNWQDRHNPSAGGAEVHLHQVFGRLARRGHHVTLLCSGWSGATESLLDVDGIRVHRTGRRYTFNLAAPLHYARHLGGEPFDIVVEDLNKVPLLATHWVRARVRVVLVHHLFGATAFREANPVLAGATWLLERLIPDAYRGLPCIAVSESTKEDLVRRGLDGADIAVIRNGVELEGLRPAAGRFAEPTVVYLGRLKRYKRVDLALQAVAELARRGIGVKMIVAGKGDARPALEETARRLGIEDRVRFAGFVSEREKLELLSRSWAHVLTSPKEGWGIASVEASACGTPSVVSDSPGLRETVRHGETGLIVPHGDIDLLAGALARLLEPGERDRMGREARIMAEEHAWDRVADTMERFLESHARSADCYT